MGSLPDGVRHGSIKRKTACSSGKHAVVFLVCESRGTELSLGDNLYGALSCARTAIDAGISVDNVLTIASGDSLYRALSCASAALQTTVVDYICHTKILLK